MGALGEGLKWASRGGENMIISWEFGILYEFALLGDR